MTRILVMVGAMGFVVAIVCFAAAGMLGGTPWDAAGPHGGWGGPWSHGWGRGGWMQGPTVVRDYPWTGGDSLHVDAPAVVDYTQGPTTRLTISGPKAMLDRLTVQGGHIGVDGWSWNAMPMKIVMTAPNVTDFEGSGSESLSIANYSQDQLVIGLSGSGGVVAKGQAKHTSLRISGSGAADLGGLASDEVTVQISGAGGATIAPKTSADVHISGSGLVTLLTHPAHLNTDISGAGSIIQAPAR